MFVKEDFPRTIDEFIGNENARKILKILIYNTLHKKRYLPNILFYGRPGLGKTTLAELVTSECKHNLFSFIGHEVEYTKFVNLMLHLTSKDVLFIDEVHSLDKKVMEIMYPILQSYKLKYDNDTVQLPRFPIIAATTDLGDIPEPFIDRFRYNIILESYSYNEFYNILNLFDTNYSENDIHLHESAKDILINISQKTPRLLKNFYFKSLDYCIANDLLQITDHVIKTVMEMNGIDENGLDIIQQKYLNYLKDINRPAGINAISAYLGIKEKDISNLVEPFLIESGFIVRTPKGRVINES